MALTTQALRSVYSGLTDAVAKGDTNATYLVRTVILPSSYINSPIQIFQLYQDAMTTVGKYGKPDLFITVTCNSLWGGLLPEQNATDRPYLVCV